MSARHPAALGEVDVLVVTRYTVGDGEGPSFLARARAALAALAACPGHLSGEVGRATDDPQLWVLSTRWASVGDYRRALSTYEVKVHAIPLLSRALDEPTAFEVLATQEGSAGLTSRRAADADTVAVGRASAPAVPSDLEPRTDR